MTDNLMKVTLPPSDEKLVDRAIEIEIAHDGIAHNYRSYGFTRKHKRWLKHVTRVDLSRQDGWCFGGEFLPPDEDAEALLPPGAYLIDYEHDGAEGNFYSGHKFAGVFTRYVRLFHLREDGSWELVKRTPNKEWARMFRDVLADKLPQFTASPRPRR